MSKPTILLLGKLPPPYFGPAVATQIILGSKMSEHFSLYHHDTKLNEKMATMGKFAFSKVGRIIGNYLKFLRSIAKTKPALVVIPISQTTSGFIKDSIYILITRLFNVKTVLHLRGSNFRSWLTSSTTITQLYVKLILRLVQAVIVLGNNLKYLFEDFFTEEKIFVIPNGASFLFLRSDRNNEVPKLLFLSNLIPAKGIEDVVKAAEILKKIYKIEFSLDVVGSWTNKAVKQGCLALKENAQLPVSFHPSANGEIKKKIFEAADIFIFPPRAPEGHPWVIVEAMAAGLPIIATDQGAIIESVLDGVNGFIIPAYNPAKIAEKIQFLISNPDTRIKMGKASYQHYCQNFTEEKMVKRLSICFKKIMELH